MAFIKQKFKIPAYKWLYIKYAVALIIGIVTGYKLIPASAQTVITGAILAYCIFVGLREQFDKLFAILPIACYHEAYMRGFVRTFPYLALQYCFMIIFGFLILKHIGVRKPHTKSFIFMLIFGVIEILNGLSPNDPILLKPILTQSLCLVVVVIWASFNKLSPILIHRMLTYIKIAGVYLTGIVLVAHIQGGIEYNTESNFGSSNGLAPVQLSGYLGFASLLFIFSFLNPQEAKYKTLNISLFILVSSVMILTFSRGGLYFVGIVMAAYIYFNRANLKSYARIIFLIPIGVMVYYIVVGQTGGAIVKRYEKKGSSNRDVLVEIAFKLFLDEPITGVGTSNFDTEIVKRKYFSQISTAHNEFVRAIAEHGIFGMITYWGFFIALFIDIFKRRGPPKEFSTYFLLLFCLIIVHNGLKISIQPLLIILAIANPTLNTATQKIFSTNRIANNNNKNKLRTA
ncbi:MAG: O-antigen ligase family protein [Bacteroidetes bacterium]|nr:O-antigen ligase family protein [Bacteroidota bacterium]